MSHSDKRLIQPSGDAPAFELRFDSLFTPGKALVFPCDAQGCVDMDTLSERARCNYLFAHAMVGKDFFSPCVSRLGAPACHAELAAA